MSISEFGSANEIQTIYVGKAPFMLRLYDKKLELSKSNKQEMMLEYFLNNGLDIEKEIFNLEFEMHRTHLRGFDITTLEDLTTNANNLFKKAMEDIRLIDINTITQKDIDNNSKNRAKSLPIWDYVKKNFNINNFLQNEFSIKRLKRKSYIYDEDRFIEEFNKLIKKALTYKLYLNDEFILAIAKRCLDDYEDKEERARKYVKPKKSYTPVKIEGDSKEYRLLKSGELIEPVKIVAVNTLSNYELEKEIITLESYLHFGEEQERLSVAQKLEIAYREKMRRKEVQNVN